MKQRADGPVQLELPLAPRVKPAGPRPKAQAAPLRVIEGGRAKRTEALKSRHAVVRVLVEAGADLLLRRISSERADEIQRSVEQVLRLFDSVDQTPALMPVLQRELDALEALMAQTRAVRGRRRGR